MVVHRRERAAYHVCSLAQEIETREVSENAVKKLEALNRANLIAKITSEVWTEVTIDSNSSIALAITTWMTDMVAIASVVAVIPALATVIVRVTTSL